MSDKNLSELLEELRKELGKPREMDEKGRQMLRNLDAEIQRQLLRSEGRDPDETFLDGLQEAIDHFEDSHPHLTSALSHMLTILSNAGI